MKGGAQSLKAAVLYGQQDIRYEDVEMPVIQEDEVLVRVKAMGICGSDMPRVLGKGAHFYPIILGHEFSGEVVELGDKVQGLAAGDKIAGAPLIPCHECKDCLQGNYSQCKHYSFIGSRTHGAWAEYVKLPGINAVKLPEGISFVQGAFYEPITVALHGLFVMDYQGGRDVAILGMGTIGLLTLQCARIFGAKRIFAFDIDEERLKVAKEYGADFCLNTRDEPFRELIDRETDGWGLEMVIETAGVEFTEKLSLEIASAKGNVMFIGTPSNPISLMPREFEYINRKELMVRGSWMSYSAPFPGREWELAGYFLEKGLIRVDRLINRIIPLADVGEAFADLAVPGRVKGKIVLEG
jgi:L-iditol 2-dehydrogenase